MSTIHQLIDPATGNATRVTRTEADATIGAYLGRGDYEARVRTYPAQGTRNEPSSAPVTVLFVRKRSDASLAACLEITDAAYPDHNTDGLIMVTDSGSFFGHPGPLKHNRNTTTAKQREEIRRRYEDDGESAISIAIAMGLTAATVRNYTPTRQAGGTKRKKAT